MDKNVHGSVIEIENDDFDDDFCGLPSSAPGSSPNYVNNLLKPINMSDSDLDEIQVGSVFFSRITFPLWLRLISAGLKPVLSHTEKS